MCFSANIGVVQFMNVDDRIYIIFRTETNKKLFVTIIISLYLGL